MDLQSLAIAVGLAVSLLFSEFFGLAAGGMVVPGYVALFLNQPISIAMTIAAALLTWGVVRALSNVIIIYGRRRTVMMILVGFLLGAIFRTASIWLCAADMGPGSSMAYEGLAIVGFIIPGLIAIWIDRQGILETLSTLLTASVAVRLVLILVAAEMLV